MMIMIKIIIKNKMICLKISRTVKTHAPFDARDTIAKIQKNEFQELG